jgi:myosin-3
MTLSATTEQTENNTPIKDPECSVPDNLVMMEEMTKEKLLEACKIRYEADACYTFVADILVAINPYNWIDMYGKQYKERYNPEKALCPVPHIYAVAQRAAKNLRLLNRDQVCIVSGESGSGKTESAKLFMHHLLSYTAKGPGGHSELEKQILESQPLLEAFGNAKTGLNDNSSRFGKYIEVMFRNMDEVLGAGARKYLLEKSRVVNQADGERNFHCFYYLTEGAPQALRSKLNLKGWEGYRYLKTGESVEDPSVWFNELDKSLRVLGFSEDDILSLWTSLAAILKTGQIEFTNIEGSTDDSCTFTDKAVAQDLADTLGVTLEKLENALTTKHVVIVGETNHKPLNAEFASMNRDTLAQNMYDNLFSWLVDELNVKLASPEEGDWRSVSVLDIFGFENFRKNEFEQMFINTANEQLQQYFINHIFTYEIKELKEEGIRAPKVDYTTNDDQVDLLLGPKGIFALLDEQTKVPNSTDATTIIKMHQNLSSNPSYDNLRNSPVQFAISHYAGKVKYQAEGLLEKNRNQPSLGIAGMIKSSTNPMIASLFKSSETTEDRLEKDMQMKKALKSGDVGFMRRQSQRHRFVGAHKAAARAAAPKKVEKKLAPWQIANMKGKVKEEKKEKPNPKLQRQKSEMRRAGLTTLSAAFKGSLEALMEMLNLATPHFVRCIKPNMTKSAKTWDGPVTQKQLNYTGVLETTKIRQNGYPLRVTFEDFCDRYRDTCIPPTYRLTSAIYESTALRILQSADLHGWGKGKTKMFLKYEHINTLVNILEGQKREANEARAKAAAEQAKKDAELAEIKRKRDEEIAKIRAAAEAQPTSKKVQESMNWQEEMALAKKKKAEAKAKKEKEDAEAAKRAAEEEANKPKDGGDSEGDEAARKKASFIRKKNLWK